MKKLLTLPLVFFAAALLNAAPLPSKNIALDQKVGQLVWARIDIGEQELVKESVEKGLVGCILIKGGSYDYLEAVRAIEDLQEWAKKSPSQIPLFIAFDYEGGAVVSPMAVGLQQLPSNMAMNAAGSPELAQEVFYQSGMEIKRIGGHVSYAPDADVNTNPENPIIGTRSFGSDPDTVSKYVVSGVKGLQKANVAAFAKHFPGHGDTEVDSHEAVPVMNLPLEDLKRLHLPPFKAAIANGVDGVMTSHVIYPAIDPHNPASLSEKVAKDLLRKELKFKGLIITDSLDMGGALTYGTMPEVAVKALVAGADLALIAKADPIPTTMEIYNSVGKTISEKQINDSYKKVIALKKKYGLFKEPQADIYSFRAAAREVAKKSVTLYKNEQKLIPLSSDIKEACAVYFTLPVFEDKITRVTKAMQNEMIAVEEVFAPLAPAEEDLAKVRECVKNKDLIIVGSTQPYASVPEQQQAIKEILDNNEKVILISTLNPYDVSVYPQAKNVIMLYAATEFSAEAAGKIITGKQIAEGKLPVNLK
ncbi:beta-N-acetylhexosaminidase [Elusimicrobium posterum]|uniref:glycoside hydrolase family 3 protein n=1 Tax=Elusimicrobium posterum TaxID=3116653 RepID=UPI003C779D2C